MPDRLTPRDLTASKPKFTLSFNERVLAYAMLKDKSNAAVDYAVDRKDGTRRSESATEKDLDALVEKFKFIEKNEKSK